MARALSRTGGTSGSPMRAGIPNVFPFSFINLFTSQTLFSRRSLKHPTYTAESKMWEPRRNDRAEDNAEIGGAGRSRQGSRMLRDSPQGTYCKRGLFTPTGWDTSLGPAQSSVN